MLGIHISTFECACIKIVWFDLLTGRVKVDYLCRFRTGTVRRTWILGSVVDGGGCANLTG